MNDGMVRSNSEPGQWDIRSGIGATALGVAVARAVETQRPDSLVNDPYAAIFAEAAGAAVPPGQPFRNEQPIGSALVDYLGVRTRFFDQWFAAAVEVGIRQAVILAAGLDTRAYRLNWAPGTTVYEIDQPLVLDFKQGVLDEQDASPSAERRQVGVDLRDDWPVALAASGFDATLPAAWLAEGLLPYLPAALEEEIFDAIDRLSATGSRLAAEFMSPDLIRGFTDDPELRSGWEQMGASKTAELWNADDRRDLATWLHENDWMVSADQADLVMERFGRPLPSTLVTAMAQVTLLTASCIA